MTVKRLVCGFCMNEDILHKEAKYEYYPEDQWNPKSITKSQELWCDNCNNGYNFIEIERPFNPDKTFDPDRNVI